MKVLRTYLLGGCGRLIEGAIEKRYGIQHVTGKLDALRVFTQASYHSIKSYFTKTCIGHNKSKLKNQDILAQEFHLHIYNSSCYRKL